MNTRFSLWAVLLATAALRVGYGAIMPIMPLYAQEHGLNTAMIAWMTNAYMIANAAFQGYAGHLGDRLGRRPVMLVGTWLYTAAAGLFMLNGGPWYYVVLRALEGVGAAAFMPASRAYVADLVPEEERGDAYGKLMAADMAGILLGPMIGGLAQSIAGTLAPFAVCTLLGLVAGLPLLALPRERQGLTGTHTRPLLPALSIPTVRVLASPAFWAVALPGVGFAYLNGLYSVVWSLYMQENGATTWQINLSYTLFAVPMVLLMVPFGRLADRVGRPLMIGIGGLGSALATLTYGIWPAPNALIGFGMVDGVTSAMFGPASQAYMADVAPNFMRGKFIGLVGTVGTIATVVFVFLIGYLYDHAHPFWLFALGALALLLGCGSAVLIMVRRPAAQLRARLEQLQGE